MCGANFWSSVIAKSEEVNPPISKKKERGMGRGGGVPVMEVASKTTTFGWVWPVKHIAQLDCRILLFFSIFAWKNQLMLIFICGVSHQRKVATETTTFGLVWLVVPLVHWIAGLFDQQHPRKNQPISLIFCMEIIIKRR